MKISKQAKKMAKDNGLEVEVNQAYIDIVGEEYAKEEDVSEAYQGKYEDDKAFAIEMAYELGLTNKELSWPYTCIDWEQAAKDLMYDYSESDGYYFRNL
jgi:antirestriction protein